MYILLENFRDTERGASYIVLELWEIDLGVMEFDGQMLTGGTIGKALRPR